MILTLLGLAFPFIKGLLGDNLVEKILADKRAKLASANELEKAKIEADIKTGEQELERRRLIRDLQLKEYEHPFMWWPKFLLMLFVCLYWAARFMVKLTGLNDFNIAIAELSEPEAVVSGMVLAYMFLGDKISRALRK